MIPTCSPPKLTRWTAIVLVFTILPAAEASAQQRPGPMYDRWDMWDGGWFGMMLGPLLMVLVVAAVVIVIVFAFRRAGSFGAGAQGQSRTDKAPLDILKERFARGEIDKQEYEERRRILKE